MCPPNQILNTESTNFRFEFREGLTHITSHLRWGFQHGPTE